jgi:hypothetical protein
VLCGRGGGIVKDMCYEMRRAEARVDYSDHQAQGVLDAEVSCQKETPGTL